MMTGMIWGNLQETSLVNISDLRSVISHVTFQLLNLWSHLKKGLKIRSVRSVLVDY